MKCPLFVLAKTAHYSENVMITTDCLKEGCAGWDRRNQNCAILSILEELRLLVGAAGMIADHMPPAQL